jgi:hypothetical protein
MSKVATHSTVYEELGDVKELIHALEFCLREGDVDTVDDSNIRKLIATYGLDDKVFLRTQLSLAREKELHLLKQTSTTVEAPSSADDIPSLTEFQLSPAASVRLDIASIIEKKMLHPSLVLVISRSYENLLQSLLSRSVDMKSCHKVRRISIIPVYYHITYSGKSLRKGSYGTRKYFSEPAVTSPTNLILGTSCYSLVSPQNKYTPLHLVAREGAKDVVSLLLEKETDVEATDKVGNCNEVIAPAHRCYWSMIDWICFECDDSNQYTTLTRYDTGRADPSPSCC